MVLGADGLPVSGREGHGIGLRSVKAAAEEYNGMCQCRVEDGKFCFRAVLFAGKLRITEVENESGIVPELRCYNDRDYQLRLGRLVF